MGKTRVRVELQYDSILTVSDGSKKSTISHKESVWRFWQLIREDYSTTPVLTIVGVAFEALISDELLTVIKKFDNI